MQDITRSLIISWKVTERLLEVHDRDLCYSCIVHFNDVDKLRDLIELKRYDRAEAWHTFNWISHRNFNIYPEFGTNFRLHYN